MGQQQTIKCSQCGFSFMKYYKDATRVAGENGSALFYWMCSNCGQGYTEKVPKDLPVPIPGLPSIEVEV